MSQVVPDRTTHASDGPPPQVLPQPHVPNTDITLDDLPDVDVRALDPNWWGGSSWAQWVELWNFALTFDAYRDASIDGDTLGQLASHVRQAMLDADTLADLFDLRWLRALLFIEQRRWKWEGAYWERCEPQHAVYLQALLEAIAIRMGRGRNP